MSTTRYVQVVCCECGTASTLSHARVAELRQEGRGYTCRNCRRYPCAIVEERRVDLAACMVRLAAAELTDRQRELWVDHRIIGIPQQELAERDGVSRQRVSQLILNADAKLASLRRELVAA